jgi:glutamate synthase domain-containing protein 2/glutamate synthase domain-containing protein 1/glutamate synthase domain-containing protein 3
MIRSFDEEKDACGVGFVTVLDGKPSYGILNEALAALSCVEHRGACSGDGETGDGAGIMTEIPYTLFGITPGKAAIATLFITRENNLLEWNVNTIVDRRAEEILKVVDAVFTHADMPMIGRRVVPINQSALAPLAQKTLPLILQLVIERPEYCCSVIHFNQMLYAAKQKVNTALRKKNLAQFVYFTSLSSTTICYKALTQSHILSHFYKDLQHHDYHTTFALFHRRFSTNTTTSWDKAQPFSLIAHNGEINTISGNRAWAITREKASSLPEGEIVSHQGTSDSGSFNEMVEALKYKSSIPKMSDILSIMIPPFLEKDSHSIENIRKNNYYKFWSRVMEPWDGPAFICFSDGETIGARLDRNGFRPCRWTMTEDRFYLSSEAGSFNVEPKNIRKKGTLNAGAGLTITIKTGSICFDDPGVMVENEGAQFDPRIYKIPDVVKDDYVKNESKNNSVGDNFKVVSFQNGYENGISSEKESYFDEIYDTFQKSRFFGYTQEDIEQYITPLALTGKEPIGSMGDTARIAILSEMPRSLFDYFYHDFAQVTNPPLDYLREEMVTDLTVYLGSKPNVFYPKELIPLPKALELNSPILSLYQCNYIKSSLYANTGISVVVLPLLFNRSEGVKGLEYAIETLAEKAVLHAREGAEILVLSDRDVNDQKYPIPSLLGLSAVNSALNREGVRLKVSLVVESGEVITSHHVAALAGYGAGSVCPYGVLSLIKHTLRDKVEPIQAEKNYLHALEQGLLKILSKMGISVYRSYHGSRLFTPVGISDNVLSNYFSGSKSIIGGLTLKMINEVITSRVYEEGAKPKKMYLFKEHPRRSLGERHSMTNVRSRAVHTLAAAKGKDLSDIELYNEYLKLGIDEEPISFRHLLRLKRKDEILSDGNAATSSIANGIYNKQSTDDILKLFGSGAMSFGAISAEAQKDIFIAMKAVGGRSNSGEGGENPYYFKEGIHASVKQIASGRFGVDAEYLMASQELQIKIAQGAKPGEGGQLMGLKVNAEIARARNSKPGIDLISPPPLHDLYSIEDLKELIYELKQLKPDVKVSVKLVSGKNISAIATGVAKAGADIIHIAGHDGGTGAAQLVSMKHAGLPWEIGLMEVHKALLREHLRSSVILRVDGGLSNGREIAVAAALGAEQFDFGKLLLVAEGCVMARICEKNTCPTGIATHDPKYKAKYSGNPEAIIKLLRYIAEDVRCILDASGIASLDSLTGRTDLLCLNENYEKLIKDRNINLEYFTSYDPCHENNSMEEQRDKRKMFSSVPLSGLNEKLLKDYIKQRYTSAEYTITSADRAVSACLSGQIAKTAHEKRLDCIDAHSKDGNPIDTYSIDFYPQSDVELCFTGSAGQGFGVFLTKGLKLKLVGEANDSVGKGMSGGKIVITPHKEMRGNPSASSIIGNCALYGATGGKLYVYGVAGDRFAVRNSGAIAVVEGAGLHACEYMTNGKILVLGKVGLNIGSGMTGGVLYIPIEYAAQVNKRYLHVCTLLNSEEEDIYTMLRDYYIETGSLKALMILENWGDLIPRFLSCVPINFVNERIAEGSNIYQLAYNQ